MDKQDAMAKILLDELKKKEKLRSIINSPGLRNKILEFIGLSVTVFALLIFIDYYYADFIQAPVWRQIVIYIMGGIIFGIIGLSIEVGRIEKRFNALVRLLEMERNEKSQPQRQ